MYFFVFIRVLLVNNHQGYSTKKAQQRKISWNEPLAKLRLEPTKHDPALVKLALCNLFISGSASQMIIEF